MSRFNLRQPLIVIALITVAITLSFCFAAGAQTTTTVPAKNTTPAKKVTAPPPAAKTTSAAPATKSATTSSTTTTAAPVAKTATTTTTAIPQAQSAATAVTPASSQTVLTPANPVSNVLSSTPVSNVMSSTPVSGVMSSAPVSNVLSSTPLSNVAPTSAVNNMTQTNGANGNVSAPADSRTPVAGQGVGTFLAGPWTLIAYGCFRSGTRLFCDFDTTNQSNTGANSEIWRPVSLVDDGGKITTRHNAFFVGDDGSQFSTAYLTAQKPARFVIEFDNVDQRYTSISLVCGRDQIQGVPIIQMDPGQPGIPARARTAQPH